ncbi:N-acetylmuramoyl-L-alanine amidase [Desulfocucumis palustris]|uniref:N-acetylmuramoyl-L-alanine amidase n=1 Tax=Desulfocucumis palustris TaxID=1898651 RepID=A0A2L2XEC6_9FIRM|nr:phosphodiester glycosidase family protein [Desulfocucumis palustris]GBF34063.1 N-acetylmuramoyl-L-alanine amidase [Desulfocucumis palustris]
MLKIIFNSVGKSVLWTVVFLCLWAAPAFALPTSQMVDSFTVTSGVEMQTHRSSSGGGSVTVYVLKIDLSNPYVKLDTIVGSNGTLEKNQGVTDMAVRSRSVAAVNGDFFQIGGDGRPIGLTYSDNKIITSPAMRSDMYGFAITNGKKPVIDVFSFSGKVTAPGGNSFPLAGINKPPYLISGGASSDTNTLQMYTPAWGHGSRGGSGLADVVEMVVSGNVVKEIRKGLVATTIPGDGYVLRGQGPAASFLQNNFHPGDQVGVEYSVGPVDDIYSAVGGQAVLIKDGSIPNSFTQEIKGRVARTAAGYSTDGKTLYLACAERSSKSQGMTQWEMAYFLLSLGVNRAVNLDGGGSTTMVARRFGEESPVLINVPEKGSVRSIPTAIGIYSTAPPGDFAGLLLKSPAKVLVGVPVNFSAKAYDQYFNPYRLAPGDVVWTLKTGEGQVNGGEITFETGGPVTVAAKKGDYEKALSIDVFDENDIAKLVVEPGSIKTTPGAVVQIKVSALCKDGTVFDLKPGQFNIAAGDGTGTVAGDRFTASATPAAGELSVSFRSLTIPVPVVVAEKEQVVGRVQKGAPLSLKLGNYFSIDIKDGSLPDGSMVTVEPLEQLPGEIPEGYEKIYGVKFSTDGGLTELSEPAEISWYTDAASPSLFQWRDGNWQAITAAETGQRTVGAAIPAMEPLLLAAQPDKSFSDMKGHWAANDVSLLAAKGIVSGFPGNVYLPQEKVTRVQFVTMLAKAMGWQPVEGDSVFSDNDIIPLWARGYLSAAVQKGVVSGYKDGSFMPSKTVTRSEMASMISRALELPQAGTDVINSFKDRNKIDNWAVDPVARSVAAGLFRGDNKNMFNPAGFATRAESAAIIARSLEYSLYKDQIIPPNN